MTEEGEVPIYEWDPYWPKLPLPNDWAMGNVAGIEVDAQDHIWVLTRPRTILHGHEDDASYAMPESQCCMPPPSVIEFDQEGNVVQGWGGPGPSTSGRGARTRKDRQRRRIRAHHRPSPAATMRRMTRHRPSLPAST